MMKTALWTMVLTAGLALAVVPVDVEAKRLGGARSSGMQRNTAPDKPAQSTPAQPANNNATTPAQTPPTAAAPAAAGATAGAAAAASKRSWLGPIAGLAAGLGLAALFSHLGWGEGLANFVMLLLLAGAAFFLIRMLMRRFAGGGMAARQPALASATAGPAARPAPPTQFVDERPGMQRQAVAPSVTIGSALQPALPVAGAAATAAALPADFDTQGFERLAKMLFIRLQAANDKADLDDLRQFTTPELFAALRLDLQERGDAVQTTDVPKVDAQLVDYAEEDGRQIVSVRFTGLVREEQGAAAEPFDEVWHVVKPVDDSRPWAIAGIQQSQARPEPQLH
jgi:predicted lipid-binding transport protein (Tim44 family)